MQQRAYLISFTNAPVKAIAFRPNVAAIVRRADGLILIGERNDTPGAWQFPQGGVKTGESHEQALARELVEEIALPASRYEIMEGRGPYRYRYFDGRKKEGFDGQEQTYYLVRLIKSEPPLTPAVDQPEFSSLRWIRPEQFQSTWVAPFKRTVYQAVFRDFFGVSLDDSRKS